MFRWLLSWLNERHPKPVLELKTDQIVCPTAPIVKQAVKASQKPRTRPRVNVTPPIHPVARKASRSAEEAAKSPRAEQPVFPAKKKEYTSGDYADDFSPALAAVALFDAAVSESSYDSSSSDSSSSNDFSGGGGDSGGGGSSSDW